MIWWSVFETYCNTLCWQHFRNPLGAYIVYVIWHRVENCTVSNKNSELFPLMWLQKYYYSTSICLNRLLSQACIECFKDWSWNVNICPFNIIFFFFKPEMVPKHRPHIWIQAFVRASVKMLGLSKFALGSTLIIFEAKIFSPNKAIRQVKQTAKCNKIRPKKTAPTSAFIKSLFAFKNKKRLIEA